MPGNQVKLRLICPDEIDTETIKWEVPDFKFEKYEIDRKKAKLTKVKNSDFDKKTEIEFFWGPRAAEGDNGDRIVKVSFKLMDGRDCKEKAKLILLDPTIEYPEGENPPQLGTWQNVDRPSKPMELVNAGEEEPEDPDDPTPPVNPTNDGISFEASLECPDKFNTDEKAEWGFAQVVTQTEALITYETGKKNAQQQPIYGVAGKQIKPTDPPSYVLDVLPEQKKFIIRDHVFPCDGEFHHSSDSPGLARSRDVYRRFTHITVYITYIFFKPSETDLKDIFEDGIEVSWVPMRYVHWQLNVCAERDADEAKANGLWHIKPTEGKNRIISTSWSVPDFFVEYTKSIPDFGAVEGATLDPECK